MSIIVPPGGMAGFSQMTPASRRALFPGRVGSGPKRRRKTRAKKARKASSKRKSRKLKFGSPAWRKKYMKK